MAGGKREGAGRPALPDNKKKIKYATKLRPDQVLWLRRQKNAASVLERLIDKEMTEESSYESYNCQTAMGMADNECQ